jgi:hypothetical protein
MIIVLRVKVDSNVGIVTVDFGETELGRRLPQTQRLVHLLPDMAIIDTTRFRSFS